MLGEVHVVTTTNTTVTSCCSLLIAIIVGVLIATTTLLVASLFFDTHLGPILGLDIGYCRRSVTAEEHYMESFHTCVAFTPVE